MSPGSSTHFPKHPSGSHGLHSCGSWATFLAALELLSWLPFLFLFVVLPPLSFFLSLFLSFSLSIFFSFSPSPKFINLVPQLSQSLGSQACAAMIHHAGLIYMHLCMYTHIFRVLRMEPKASSLVLCHWVTLQSLPCVLRKHGSQVTYSLSEANKSKTYKTVCSYYPCGTSECSRK